MIDLIPSFSSIKSCLHDLSKLVLVLVLVLVMILVAILVLKGRYQEIRVARAFFVSIRLYLSKETLSLKRERACPSSLQALQDLCS